MFDNSVREKESLQRNIALTAARMKRASKLITALADEQTRFVQPSLFKIHLSLIIDLSESLICAVRN